MKKKDVTIYDIAEALKISPATVSRGLKNNAAINKDTRKKVLDAATKMGYRFNRFASNLRSQRTHTLGVIVPRLNSSFMSDVLAGMEKVANESGYNLITSQSLETVKKETANVVTMFNNRVDGLLVSLSYDTKNIDHFLPFIDKGIPLLFFDRVFEHTKCPAILIDNFKAGYEATAHLIGQGCKNIAHITGNQSRNVYLDRLRGYKQALSDHRLPFRGSHVIFNSLSPREGMEAAEQLLEMSPRPDGVFVANDACAASCMQALKKAGLRIPADMGLAGFNNDFISSVVEPSLTTINYPGYEMGEVAVRTLISHLDQGFDLNLTQTILLRHELIVRESSLKSGKRKRET